MDTIVPKIAFRNVQTPHTITEKLPLNKTLFSILHRTIGGYRKSMLHLDKVIQIKPYQYHVFWAMVFLQVHKEDFLQSYQETKIHELKSWIGIND